MSETLPHIFLSFANDHTGAFLHALEPERRALRSELSIFQRNGWGYYHSSSSSAARHLIEDLQLYPRQISIFHFSGHADGESLQLESQKKEQQELHQNNLLSILKEEAQNNLKLVFLNACETKGMLEGLQELNVPAVILTDAVISDRQAKEFSLAFYRSLLNGSSLETAFSYAKTLINSSASDSRVFRAINLSYLKNKKVGDEIPWGLHVQDDSVLNWRLLKGKASDPKSETKALNKIPGSHQDFVGRDKELRELRHLLQKEKPVLLLNGIGGIGKTTLARQYLHDNYFHFDRVLWVSVLSEQADEEKGFQTATEALGNDIELLEHLGMVFEKEQSAADRVEEMLKRLRTQTGKNLLVIDNAGFSLEEIRRILPQAPHWQVLITSRKELSGLAVKRLDELPPEEALDLFYLHYPQGQQEAKDVEALLEHIGYHTLTLELFAKTCEKSPNTNPDKILKLLQEKELEKLSRKVFVEHSDREVEVYGYLLAAFELNELTEDELSILVQWAILPPLEIEWELLCKLFSVDEHEQEEFENLIFALLAKGWIGKGKLKTSYYIHQLIQELLRYKYEPDGENCEAVIQGINQLLLIDEGKDNPIKKFVFIPYGLAILFFLDKRKTEGISNLQNNLGLVYFYFGKYEIAVSLFQFLLSNTPETIDDNLPFIATVRSNLGITYQQLGEYNEAERLLNLALDFDLKQFGEDDLSTAKDKSNLAMVYYELAEFERAVALLESALSSFHENLDEDHPSTSNIRSNLALVYKELGEYEKAVGLLEKSLSSDLKNLDEDHPSIARLRSNLALVYQALGFYDQAVDFFNKSLSSDLKNFGNDHPSVAIVRSNLAAIYFDLGEYEKAVNLFEQSLTSCFMNFGEEHPSTARVRSNLALVYHALGEYEEAERLLDLALTYYLSHFGQEHSLTAKVRSNLAMVYISLKDYAKASDLLEKAILADLKNLGEDHSQVSIERSNLAIAYYELGEYDKAVFLLEKALSSDLMNFGEDHPSTARVRSNLALVYQASRRYFKAKDLLELSLSSLIRSFGEFHPSTAMCRMNLATIFLDLNKQKEAKELLIKAYDSFETKLGSDHPDTLNCKRWLDGIKG